ncbi:MAG: hypothetical protein AB8G22_23350 [Saprospiraceae bacterium]
MEDNNNLDGFFKNKLNDFSDESSDWDRPRGNAWSEAQQQLATQSVQQFKKKALGGGILLGLLLLLSSGTSAYLYFSKSNLSQVLAQKEAALQQQIAILETVRADCEAKTMTTSPVVKEVTTTPGSESNPMTTSAMFTKPSSFSKHKSTSFTHYPTPPPVITEPTRQSVYNYTPLIQQLRDSIQILNHQLIEKEVELLHASMKALPTVSPLPNSLSPLVFNHHTDSALQVPEIRNIPLKKSPKVAPGQRFEAGLKLSFLPYSVPISSNIANVGSIQGNSEDYEGITDISGLKLGIGLRPNLYLQTGIRPANFGLINTSISGIIYDKSSEFTRSNGTVANNIILESRTSFSDVDQSITVEIPAGTELETGDLLLMTLTNFQNVDFLQIPLGISFFQGKKRWQLEYMGGLIYNFVDASNYDIQAEFQANNIDIPVGDIRIINEDNASSHFLTAYLGIGANYRLSNRWHARANLTIEDNSHNFDSKQFFRFNDVGVGLNFSLNYRF